MSFRSEDLAASVGSAGSLPAPPQPASVAAADVFDREVAIKRCLNNDEMLQEMVECFFCEVDSLFPQMRSALQKGDLVEVGRLGHRMKGTVVYLGAEAARKAAMRVEHFERHSATEAEAKQAVKAFEQQCEILKSVLATDRTTT